ncbi:hypothetical protein AM571_CH02404 [Rhizobium etli 8C-3]|uniref:Sce7726 family protein n=2 Tax=Rhizobium etli TaxID=29449 RepID=A0A1L5P4Y9_RHIET|nr:hypothetical protein AM571_CH02404 [Rhizobium etli 8C-3]
MKQRLLVTTDDAMMRQAVRTRLALAHAGEDAVIVDELKVSRGSCRMDVAVINGRIEGYEIKSDKDTLERLSRQAEMFGLVADRMTLVVGHKHLEKARTMVPGWWSIMTPSSVASDKLDLVIARRGRLNRKRDKRALIEALERDELIAMLEAHGIDKGYRTVSYHQLADHAAERLSRDEIALSVKKMLKVRARLGAAFGDRAFGRNAIICSEPSA